MLVALTRSLIAWIRNSRPRTAHKQPPEAYSWLIRKSSRSEHTYSARAKSVHRAPCGVLTASVLCECCASCPTERTQVDRFLITIAPVTLVIPSTTMTNITRPKGRKVVICKARTRPNITYATCGLCARQRDCIVAFPALGPAKEKIWPLTGTGLARSQENVKPSMLLGNQHAAKRLEPSKFAKSEGGKANA